VALATIGTLVVVYIVVRPPAHVSPEQRDLSKNPEVAEVVGPRLITVVPGSALEQKLDIRHVRTQTVRFPILTVTGSIAARFVGGSGKPEDRWQFQSADVSSAFADWLRGQNDVEYSGKQLEKTRELAAAQVAHFREVYERMLKLVETGTEAKKDLAAAKADLVQGELQAKKNIFDAESALNVALRNRAAAERQLLQAGVDPSLLTSKPDDVIVVAEVPEVKVLFVKTDEPCEARFYGIPDTVFPARVARIAPTLSIERRTLRVLFDLQDPSGRLKPGMFADIGLGTEPREALLVPVDAVLHAGNTDFVFSRGDKGPWHVTDVEVGEPRGPDVEIRTGLAAGAEIIGSGAILLKPFLLQAIGT
jgi:hypothetical protein